ncbi:MAG: hypothetical protein UW71_C0020G0013 [Parcubacteria group bacterium GW2011_GWB1_44_7]|nr:MAG: hypothetical protein UW71_C0020G0013 [Parcubacteria group bacterium GW2011_GWB1_44_7]
MDTQNKQALPQQRIKEDGNKNAGGNYWSAFGLALELGWHIAIPLVILAVIGRLADKTLNTSPWLFLLGILASIAVSVYLIYRKVKNILNNP